jgi:hypothetical protein
MSDPTDKTTISLWRRLPIYLTDWKERRVAIFGKRFTWRWRWPWSRELSVRIAEESEFFRELVKDQTP